MNNIQISVLILLIIFKRNPEIQQTTFLGHPHSTVSIKSEAVTFSQVGMILKSYCKVTVFESYSNYHRKGQKFEKSDIFLKK